MATTKKTAATKTAKAVATKTAAPKAAAKGAGASKSAVKRFRAHVEHIEGAKKSETRQRRIENSIQLLAAGRKEPRG